MKYICVFCGSSEGKGNVFIDAAKSLGKGMAKNHLGLVYGGASIGVMGALANACLEKGGEVLGVIPRSIAELEIAHQKLTRLETVDSMHERKQRMYELSDAFVALPGGMGTLDELCEITTWSQLGLHKRPIFVLNEGGFYDHLLEHFRKIHKLGFLSKEHLELVQEVNTQEELLQALAQ